ncbi:MAG: TFIIB-type zinc ribbon-containing protein [Candidatus Norongarragalinales archaeon]
MKSPPLSILKHLFYLKFVCGITDVSVLAQEMGCNEETAESVDRALRQHLKQKIGIITRDRLEFVCPECLEAKVYYDHEKSERVCGNCGYVFDEPAEFDQSLPYDTTYALTSDLAYDKSLGGTLNGKALMRVIAQSPASNELAKEGNLHLGVRARVIKVIADSTEEQAALKQAYDLSKEYGLESDPLFNNILGKEVRRALYFCKMERKPTRGLVPTCFLLVLRLAGKKALADEFEAKMRGRIKYPLMSQLAELNTFLASVEKYPPKPYILSMVLEKSQ